MIYVDHFLLSQLPLGGHPRHTGARKSFSIYEKLQAIREVDRLVEEGVTSGIEKRVMETFKHMFAGCKGYKSGMLGRWLTQADAQKWREIPLERMSAADRSMKELPDWVRIPLGMCPRSLERFRDGKQVPACVVTSLVKIVERLTCGAEDSPLTCGNLSVKNLQAEANRLLKSFWEAQEEANPDTKIPKKMEVSEKWINRFLDKNGWTRRAPNTCGAYLEYDDERMQRSRQTFSFTRIGQEVPLALCINFDQIWRQTWPDPKRVLLRFSDCSVSEFLSSKRRQALQEMANMQQADASWAVKRRRLTGREWSVSKANTLPDVYKCVYTYIYRTFLYIYTFIYIYISTHPCQARTHEPTTSTTLGILSHW